MKNDLFRREAVEHRKHKALGDVILINPLSFTVLTSIVLSVMIAASAFLAFGSYTRKETVAGYLVPSKGLVKLYPPFNGRVAERHIAEGDLVRAGDILLVVTVDRRSTSESDIETVVIAEMEERRHTLLQQIEGERKRKEIEVQVLRDQITALGMEIEQVERELDIQRRQSELLFEKLTRARELLDEGHISLGDFQEIEREVLRQQAIVEGLLRNQHSLAREKQTSESRVSLMKNLSETRISEYDKQISTIDQQLAELRLRTDFAVRAPQDGIITAVTADSGENILLDKPLVTILPSDARLEAKLYIPTRAVGFVDAGHEVRLRYQAFPFQRFGVHRGTITQLSRTAMAPNEIVGPLQLSEPVYSAIVLLDSQNVVAYGKEFMLKPGMLLEADIVLDRHSLFRWLLDPLYTVKERI